jgi:hypothetical protein
MEPPNFNPNPGWSEPPPDHNPTPEQIAALAYHIWEEEGRPEGRSAEHWREAESLLQARTLETA